MRCTSASKPGGKGLPPLRFCRARSLGGQVCLILTIPKLLNVAMILMLLLFLFSARGLRCQDSGVGPRRRAQIPQKLPNDT